MPPLQCSTPHVELLTNQVELLAKGASKNDRLCSYLLRRAKVRKVQRCLEVVILCGSRGVWACGRVGDGLRIEDG